jgi:hypothetical protein
MMRSLVPAPTPPGLHVHARKKNVHSRRSRGKMDVFIQYCVVEAVARLLHKRLSKMRAKPEKSLFVDHASNTYRFTRSYTLDSEARPCGASFPASAHFALI